MSDQSASDSARAAPERESKERVFLVVVDDSEELKVALRYACLRASRTGGRIALLRVVEPADFQHWMAVGDLMREEAREEAEQLLQKLAAEVVDYTDQMPILYVREGPARDELVKLIEEEPAISILVLAAAAGEGGPGPLISFLASKGLNKLRVPLTIVPGTLTDEQLEAVT